MKVEIIGESKSPIDLNEVPSGTLLRFRGENYCGNANYAILIKDIDGESPILYDIVSDVYYDDIDSYDMEIVDDKIVKLVIE